VTVRLAGVVLDVGDTLSQAALVEADTAAAEPSVLVTAMLVD
jgi:hypothetical protein